MTGSEHSSPGDIQFRLVYDRGQCADSSYLKLGFHYTANATITTQKQSDYRAEQSNIVRLAASAKSTGQSFSDFKLYAAVKLK